MGKEIVLESHIAKLNSWLPHMKGKIVYPLDYTRLEEMAQWVRVLAVHSKQKHLS